VNKELVVLHLEKGAADAPSSEAWALRGTLEGAFETLTEVLTAADDGALADLVPRVDRVRNEISGGAAAPDIEPLARTCYDATRSAAAEARARAADRRSQIAGLVGMVRETVAAISGEQNTFHDSLAGSAQRFERLAKAADLEQIQAELFAEVARLRAITIERRTAWERTVQEFGTRLTTLETQLADTRREAAIDPLTNVANRRTFERTCREWLRPNGPGFVMALADVDDFKRINDRHGHGAGDRVLMTVAETIGRSLRPSDLVARIGGDEFAVLAAGLTLQQAEKRFNSIGRAVQDACRPIIDGIGPSISIGIAECSAGDTLASLQQRADAALYQAKRSGKGRLATKASPLIRDLRSR
jgi:diguanylate cyclase (GGDEF)-like protein